jgi:hypothetical protein
VSTLPFPRDEDEPSDFAGQYDPDDPPYEPTPQDLLEYAEWSAAMSAHDSSTCPGECPADYGLYCDECDREMASAMARAALAMSDGWYLDLCFRADHPGANGSNPDWRVNQ